MMYHYVIIVRLDVEGVVLARCQFLPAGGTGV